MLGILKKINKQQIVNAGPRYTPGIDPSAPNLEIAEIQNVIDSIGLTKSYREKYASLLLALKKYYLKETRHLEELHREADVSYKTFLARLAVVQDIKPAKAYPQIDVARNLATTLSEHLKHGLASAYEEERKISATTQSAERDGQLSSIQHRIHKLREQQDVYRPLTDFLNDITMQVLQSSALVILGGWGTGKTHLLCDATAARDSDGRPTLFILAHHIPPNQNPLDGIAKQTRLARTGASLLNKLNAEGRKRKKRALLIIDGINEGDREAWRRELDSIPKLLKGKPWVGIVLSCRSPFNEMIAPAGFPSPFVTVHHPGFDGIELDAQEAFFSYYDIPFPEVPLLSEEFSRPLTLKIICESFCGLERKVVEKGFNGIASGQKSMTYVLEQFIKKVGQEIEDELRLPSLFFWNLLKGSKKTRSGTYTGLAMQMAHNSREYVTRSDALSIINDHLPASTDADPKDVLQRACAAGILTEDYAWLHKQRRNEEVVRLPYQRFSDHLIARHLLDQLKKCDSVDDLCAALKADQPVGKIFQPSTVSFASYESPGIAEAIIAEFPERVRRLVPLDEREIAFYLPKESQEPGLLCEPFIKGLSWRNPDSITKQTDKIVGFFLSDQDEVVKNELFDVLVALGTKRNHPYSASRLWRNLVRQSLWERDLSWTEYLRATSHSSAPHRICSWIEKSAHLVRSHEIASELIVALSLFLTSTDRYFRDRATRAIVLLGERHPAALLSHTKVSLEINDPYVWERMLAASYGVLMSLQTMIRGSSIKASVRDFAEFLYSSMFKPSGKYRTCHCLARDYAVGCLKIAERTAGFSLRPGQRRFIKKPFRQITSPFPHVHAITDAEFDEGDSAIQMDFGNYTIGHLIDGRANYDDKHPGYISLRRQIAWRINNLGFTKERFQYVDRNIANSQPHTKNDNEDKIDRYGKKYSWIAYFEAWGLRDAQGLLREYAEHRPSESDIDPCFPDGDVDCKIATPFQFPKNGRSPAAWAKDGPTPDMRPILVQDNIANRDGPWVLIDGHFNYDNLSDPRQIWISCRGLLVDRDKFPALKEKFLSIEWPGNHATPEVGSDHYTFAGEVPWSENFCGWLRDKSGNLLPHREEAYSFHRTRTGVKKLKRAWKRYYEIISNSGIKPTETPPRSTVFDENALNNYDSHLKIIEAANSGLPSSQKIGFFDLHSQPSRSDVENGYWITSWQEIVPGVQVEMPAFSIAFSGNDITKDHSRFQIPAPRICEVCGLLYGGRQNGMVDSQGRTASISVKSLSPIGRQSNALYLRADILEHYLSLHNLMLVWTNWGEREFHYSLSEKLREDKVMRGIWQKHQNVHRRLVVFENANLLVEFS